MPIQAMIDTQRIHGINQLLSEPYELSPNSPYLSEGQLELCRLTFAERAEWMGQWLKMAQDTGERDESEDEWE